MDHINWSEPEARWPNRGHLEVLAEWAIAQTAHNLDGYIKALLAVEERAKRPLIQLVGR